MFKRLNKNNREKGVALVLVMLISVIFILVSASLLYMLSFNYQLLMRNQKVAKLTSISESGVDVAHSKLKMLFSNLNIPKLKPDIKFAATTEEMKLGKEETTDDTKTLAGEKASSSEDYFPAGNYYRYNFTEPGQKTAFPVYYRISDLGWTDNGMVSGNSTKRYKVESMSKNARNLWSGITAEVEIERKNLFNYSLFFNDELQLYSEKDFKVTGNIHSNGNIYLDTLKNIEINGALTSGRHIYRGIKGFEKPFEGVVNIADADGEFKELTSANDSIAAQATWKTDSDWKKRAIETWKGSVQDFSHGVPAKFSVNERVIATKQHYEQEADLKIVSGGIINGNNSEEYIYVYDGLGNTLFHKDIIRKVNSVTETVRLNNLGIDNSTFSTASFYDRNEKMNVQVTVIDFSKLNSANVINGEAIIYAVREDALADAAPLDYKADNNRKPYGFMIKNAAQLRVPMFFVTENPLYLKGNINKHQTMDGTPITEDSSLFGDSAYDSWKPFSVISDSVTLLSEAWNGSANTAAVDTEYNLAFISGIVRLANPIDFNSAFLRENENWKGVTKKVRGSLIQLWNSRYATGIIDINSRSMANFDFSVDQSFINNDLSDFYTDNFPSTTERVEIVNWKKINESDSQILKDLTRLNIL